MHQLVSRSNPCLQSVTRKRYSELCASMTLTQQASCLGRRGLENTGAGSSPESSHNPRRLGLLAAVRRPTLGFFW